MGGRGGDTRNRPFYAHPSLEDERSTTSFDLLFRGLEVTTGSHRIHLYPTLLENAERFRLSAESPSDYLSIFKSGCPPHGSTWESLFFDTTRVRTLYCTLKAPLTGREQRMEGWPDGSGGCEHEEVDLPPHRPSCQSRPCRGP